MSHEAWMRAAIAEGKAGAAKGNIGVGSVICATAVWSRAATTRS